MPYELVYTSRAASGQHPRFVADIVRRARTRNRQADITGVLVFDGARFCQLLEGRQEAVLQLADAIRVDTRHENYRVLHQGLRDGARRFQGWELAYALLEGEDVETMVARFTGGELAGHLQTLNL